MVRKNVVRSNIDSVLILVYVRFEVCPRTMIDSCWCI